MHDTARETGELFFKLYGMDKDKGSVLDVGSFDVNGTLRPYVPPTMSYCGADMTEGPNVNVVLDDPHRFPFGHEEFDLVVSTSCLEHDVFFWLTFIEMARVVKPGGFIYLSAPTGGVVHNHPVDCWRFYPDAGLALARWAKRNSFDVDLVESFILPPGAEGWSDFVAVFHRANGDIKPAARMNRHFPIAFHLRS